MFPCGRVCFSSVRFAACVVKLVVAYCYLSPVYSHFISALRAIERTLFALLIPFHLTIVGC